MLCVSEQIPQCPGYVFMGWTDAPADRIVTYNPGEQVREPKDLDLYAVWRSQDALPETLRIRQAPDKLTYIKGDALDTAGMVLEYVYAGGAGYRITEGFAVEGYDPDLCETQTLTVTYQDLRTTYQVQVLDHVPGDMDGNRLVDRDDVMQLLWHITFPDMYPLDVPADFTADGKLDRDDVMQLLWHITFPELYPL